MRINRAAHIPWAIFVLAASAAAGLFYVAQFDPSRVPPAFRFFGEKPLEHATIGGTPLGLIFGAVSLGIFVFAALLGVRKKLPLLPIGNVQRWLRGHIWLTLLTVPLILFHSGFHLGGPMTTLLMALYAVVMLSGIYGLVLQHRMPTLMKDRLPGEIVYDQIPNIRAQLCASAKRLHQTYAREETRRSSGQGRAAVVDAAIAADAESELVLSRFIERQLLPYLEARRGEKFRLGHARDADDTFRHLQLQVAAPYRLRVEEMRGWCNERRLLDAQTRMQHWLHGWLLVHVPISFLLLLLTAWHAFVTLFHY